MKLGRAIRSVSVVALVVGFVGLCSRAVVAENEDGTAAGVESEEVEPVSGDADRSSEETIEAPAVTFFLPTPQGWRNETIPFPLSFAPELTYEGLEELRFAPGMMTADAEDYWTYAFVWWLPRSTKIDTGTLQSDLERYFRGLTLAVAESREFDPGEVVYAAPIETLDADKDGHQRFWSRIETYDPFVTQKPIVLQARIETFACPGQDRLVVFFLLSPQPETHPIWQTLTGIRDGFLCLSPEDDD